MKNDKKVFILIEVILAVIVLIVAIFMIQESADTENPKISVIIQDSENSRWDAFKYGLEMAAADHDVEMYVVSTGEVLTAEEEETLIASELNNGAKGIILQPVFGDESEKILQKYSKKVPFMQVEAAVVTQDGEPIVSVTKPEYYKMGLDLATEILNDFNGSLEGKTVGIVSSDPNAAIAKEKEQGIIDTINPAGGEILWSVKGYSKNDGELSLPAYPEVDILIALEDDCLVEAGEATAAGKLHGALVYGIGSSMEAFYYLDTGCAECLIVPDEFNLGYQSLSKVAEGFHHASKKAEELAVSHTVVRRENLFSEENENILFSLTQ